MLDLRAIEFVVDPYVGDHVQAVEMVREEGRIVGGAQDLSRPLVAQVRRKSPLHELAAPGHHVSRDRDREVHELGQQIGGHVAGLFGLGGARTGNRTGGPR